MTVADVTVAAAELPTRTLSTPELQRGDLVHDHGMLLLIDGDPILSQSHRGSRTYYYPALVLNRAQVPDHRVPFSWTGYRRYGVAWPDGEHRWTVQGNQRAHWSVTRWL